MSEERQLDRCSKCGFCNSVCPAFRSALAETVSPRGFTTMIDAQKPQKALYNCTLCKACTFECPAKIDLQTDLRKARQELAESGKETEANKIMIDNIRKHGNPFGEVKKGEKPKNLYCC